MKRVAIISPLSGNFQANTAYAKECLRDCLRREEAGWAGHLLYPLILDDDVNADRALGMKAGKAWLIKADVAAVYLDRGFSSGMSTDVYSAIETKVRVEMRRLTKGTIDFAAEDAERLRKLQVDIRKMASTRRTAQLEMLVSVIKAIVE